MPVEVRPSHVGLDIKSKRFVVYMAVIVSSIIALLVICVVAIMPLIWPEYKSPETLNNWGGLIIGFYFGSFISLLKDWSRESVEVIQSEDNRTP
ncbi:hypothetical protein [Sulfitobacter aestuariivivens]|uniref:Uncharacterized protein n=1 Tax=Sulfitobacter aestuariivivens TaxID=2766981 RepID=A0A927HFN9_9RHOB|nr:hypothetical protein [Sulfitobacter aestuariivivens]MBD3664629.1 hypothetical protein [Sulfitobacter aestuariivivens]